MVQNTFIDQYMPHANGEFVKVYLYLLRCANTDRELSISSIADVFDHTEKDVRRALTYWENQRLIRLKLASDGTVLSATFCEINGQDFNGQSCSPGAGLHSVHIADSGCSPFPVQADKPAASCGSPSASENASAVYVPASDTSSRQETAPSRARIDALKEQEDIRQLIFVAEQYLQRPLTSTELSDFIYYYDTLQFSTDLIEYLLEYCISKGSTSRHYMKKVALSWAEAGISTVLQAKQETNLHNRNYFTVLNTFGIKGRGPAIPEQEFMSRWFNDFGFSETIVVEACKRTIRQTHQPNFQYTDKILAQWHEKGVKSMSDITRLDQQRKAQQKKQPARTQVSEHNRFNNFAQRKYDYTQLEQQLLNQQA